MKTLLTILLLAMVAMAQVSPSIGAKSHYLPNERQYHCCAVSTKCGLISDTLSQQIERLDQRLNLALMWIDELQTKDFARLMDSLYEAGLAKIKYDSRPWWKKWLYHQPK